MNTWFPIEQTWAIWTVLLAGAAFGLWVEKTKFGKKLSGAVATMGFTFVLSNVGVIPAEGAEAYDVVWSYLVPLAIPLLLFRADIRRIVRESGPTLVAFSIGAVGTVIGTIVAYYVVPLGSEGWKVAGIFCATYIGGSINYAATAEALGLRSGDLLSAGVAADNLVMVLYFLILFTLPYVAFLKKIYKERPIYKSTNEDLPATKDSTDSRFPSIFKSTLSFALAAGVCAVGYGIAEGTGFQGGGILLVTATTVILATAFPKAFAKLEGAEVIGSFLIQIFFAVIGASANVAMVFRVGPILFVFAALILAIHLAFLLVGGFIFKLDLIEMVIASNANMGGPTTAAAMAVARRWDRLVLPAILVGTFGYSVATFIGVGLGNWLR